MTEEEKDKLMDYIVREFFNDLHVIPVPPKDIYLDLTEPKLTRWQKFKKALKRLFK